MYSTLKRRGSDSFHVVSTWNKRGVFVGLILTVSMKMRVGSICIVCCISGMYLLLYNIIINRLRPIIYQSSSNKMIFEIHSSTSSDNETLQRLQHSQVSLDDEFLSLYPVFNEITITRPSSGDKTFQRLQQSQVLLDDQFLLTHPVFKEFNITPLVDKRFVHLLVIITTGPQRHDRRKAIRDTWWSQCKNQVRNWFKLQICRTNPFTTFSTRRTWNANGLKYFVVWLVTCS